MSSETEDRASFSKWIARPQSLIALSAVLLSLCGLFIAIYEASLIRGQQRASVWPYVEVAASLTRERIEVRVQNTGVGPARVRAAAVSRDGETKKGWRNLIEDVGVDPDGVAWYYSLTRGRVLPRDSTPEVMFRLTETDGAAAPEVVEALLGEIHQGRIEVSLCYCSVFDECWMSSLQDVVRRSRGVGPAATEREVESCDAAPRSEI